MAWPRRNRLPRRQPGIPAAPADPADRVTSAQAAGLTSAAAAERLRLDGPNTIGGTGRRTLLAILVARSPARSCSSLSREPVSLVVATT